MRLMHAERMERSRLFCRLVFVAAFEFVDMSGNFVSIGPADHVEAHHFERPLRW